MAAYHLGIGKMSRACEFFEQVEMFGDMTEKQGAGLLNPGPPQGGEGATPSVSSTGASFNSKIVGSDPADGGATPPVPAIIAAMIRKDWCHCDVVQGRCMPCKIGDYVEQLSRPIA